MDHHLHHPQTASQWPRVTGKKQQVTRTWTWTAAATAKAAAAAVLGAGNYCRPKQHPPSCSLVAAASAYIAALSVTFGFQKRGFALKTRRKREVVAAKLANQWRVLASLLLPLVPLSLPLACSPELQLEKRNLSAEIPFPACLLVTTIGTASSRARIHSHTYKIISPNYYYYYFYYFHHYYCYYHPYPCYYYYCYRYYCYDYSITSTRFFYLLHC